MKVAIVVPARLGAKRLPEKPLRELGGKPLIVRVWERVVRMNFGDRIVVATDHPRIEAAVKDAGGEVVMTSPSCPSGTARVAEVAAMPTFSAYDAFVNIQGDEPFIGINSVRGAAEIVTSGQYEIGTSAVLADNSIFQTPDIVKVVRDQQGRALYFSRAPIPYLRDSMDEQERLPFTLQHVGVYAYTKAALNKWVSLPEHPLEIIERLEQLRPLAHGMAIGVAVVDDAAEAGIDTESDLAKANSRISISAENFNDQSGTW